MSPLDKQNPLAQLNDIISPNSANIWPPAPIYWLLLIVLLLLLSASIYFFKQYAKQRKKQQLALQKLQQLKNNKANFVSLNQLLKGVALQYFPRTQVASLHGEQWFIFLQTYAATPLFESNAAFQKRLYSENDQPCSSDDFVQSKRWIKQLPKQIKKHLKKAISNV